MNLNADDLAWLRSEVGPEPTDTDLEARMERLGDRALVAVEVLRTRRARLLASPLRVTIPGVAQADSTENLKAIETHIARLEAVAETTDRSAETVTVTRLTRRWSR